MYQGQEGRPTEYGVEVFQEFVSVLNSTIDRRGDHGVDQYVDYYLRRWLDSGQGIDVTAGKYSHYIRTVVAIGDATIKNEISYDFVGNNETPAFSRTILGLRNPNGGVDSYFDDPMWYDTIVADVRRARVLGITPQ